MSTIVIRPASNISGTSLWGSFEDCNSPGVTADPEWQVLADDGDTWVQTGDPSQTLRVACALNSVTPGHQRNRVRVRQVIMNRVGVSSVTKIEGGRNNNVGAFFVLCGGNITTTPQGDCGTVLTSSAWVTAGIPPDQDTRFDFQLTHISGGVSQVKEVFFDIDERAQPTIDPDILDGAGNPVGGGTMTDTNIPTATFGDIDTDGLTVNSWRVALYTLAQTGAPGFVPFETTPLQSFSGIGSPSNFAMAPIANGDYVAYYELTANIRASGLYSSDIEEVPFEVDNDPPPGPDSVTATVTANPPSIEVCWEGSPGSDEWDDPSEVVAEVERTDCNGTVRIAAVVDGINGCFTDCHFGLNPEPGCESEEPCEITYRVRYWGRVDGIIAVSDWVEDE